MSGHPPFPKEEAPPAHTPADPSHVRDLVKSVHVAPTKQRAKEIHQIRQEAAKKRTHGASIHVSSVRIFDLDEELDRRSSHRYALAFFRPQARNERERGKDKESSRMWDLARSCLPYSYKEERWGVAVQKKGCKR
jgi:hypothetical protein